MEENIKTFQMGETMISISDKYCRNVSPEEVEKILANIVTISIGYVRGKGV